MGETTEHVTYTAKCPCGRDAQFHATHAPTVGSPSLRIDCVCKVRTDATR